MKINLYKFNKNVNVIRHFPNAGKLQSAAVIKKTVTDLLANKCEYECIKILEDASDRFPDDDQWSAALASVWMNLGDFDKALAWADTALEINPNNEVVFINRVCWLAARCDDPLQAKKLFEAWGQRFMDPLTEKACVRFTQNLNRHRVLRVGYVSGDFKNHSVRYFIEPILAGHNRERVEVHAFMTMAEDEVSQFLKPCVDHWHDVSMLNDEAMLTLVRQYEIDILVDLSGHTNGQRLSVFARRAAPVQVTWFGFMQTLGMKAMDWRLTDHGMSPLVTDQHFTEKLFRLQSMVAYGPPLNSDAQFSAPYLKNGFVTFVSMNNVRKLSDEVLGVWRSILTDNPNSGLIVIANEKNPEMAITSTEPRLKAADLPMDRVSIVPRLNMLKFMGMASVADFALDSFPISGGTTTLHSLWMGLPTLCLDDPLHGGMSSSTAVTMKGLGLNECVAINFDQYKDIASDWINNPTKIEQLRLKCRPALQKSDLMNHAARANDVEDAFQFMWNAYVDAVTVSSGCTT